VIAVGTPAIRHTHVNSCAMHIYIYIYIYALRNCFVNPWFMSLGTYDTGEKVGMWVCERKWK